MDKLFILLWSSNNEFENVDHFQWNSWVIGTSSTSLQTVFPNHYTNLHSSQKCIKIPTALCHCQHVVLSDLLIFANLVGDGCSLWLYFVSLRLLVIRTSYHLNFLKIIFYWDITDINIVLVLGVQLKDLIHVYIFVFFSLICITYHKVPRFYPCCGKWLPFLKIGF